MQTIKVVRRWDTKAFWGCEFEDGMISLRGTTSQGRWAAATWDADGTPAEDPGYAGYELSLYCGSEWARRIQGLTPAEALSLAKAWVSVK